MDEGDWLDDPVRFFEGLVVAAALSLAIFAAAAAIVIFLAHYPA